jgi:hypothetical protein
VVTECAGVEGGVVERLVDGVLAADLLPAESFVIGGH